MAICVFPLVNAATLKKPEWKEGDYWEHELVGNINEKVITRIFGIENLTIGGTAHNCIVATVESNASRKIVYYDRESLAVVKEMIYNDETEEKIYDPPLSLFKYPIFIGKKWNTTIEWMNTSTTIRLECNGKKEISTRAGKFDCYIIKANYILNETANSYFYQVIYASDVVGNIVRVESYANNTLVFYSELLSFHYSLFHEEEQQPFAIIVVIVVIVVFFSLLALIKFRRTR